MSHNNNIGDFLATCPQLSVEQRTIHLRSADDKKRSKESPVQNGVGLETVAVCEQSSQTAANVVSSDLYDAMLKRTQRAEEEVLLLKHMLANCKLDHMMGDMKEKLGSNNQSPLVASFLKRIADERKRLQELLALNLSRLRGGYGIDDLAEITLVIELAELQSIVDAVMPAVLPPVVIKPEHLPLLEQMMSSLVRMNSTLADNQIMLQATATNDLLAMLSMEQNQQRQTQIELHLQQQHTTATVSSTAAAATAVQQQTSQIVAPAQQQPPLLSDNAVSVNKEKEDEDLLMQRKNLLKVLKVAEPEVVKVRSSEGITMQAGSNNVEKEDPHAQAQHEETGANLETVDGAIASGETKEKVAEPAETKIVEEGRKRQDSERNNSGGGATKKKSVVKAVPVKLGNAPPAGNDPIVVDDSGGNEDWGSEQWEVDKNDDTTEAKDVSTQPAKITEPPISIQSLMAIPFVKPPTPNLIPAHLVPKKPERNLVEVTRQSFPLLADTNSTSALPKSKKKAKAAEEVPIAKGFSAHFFKDAAAQKAPPVSATREPIASRSVAGICDIQLYDDSEDDDDDDNNDVAMAIAESSGSWEQVKKKDTGKSGFDRLLAKMEREFPSVGSAQVQMYLEMVQDRHSGNLKGLAASQVLTEIRDLIEERKLKQASAAAASAAAKTPKPDYYKTRMCANHLKGLCQRGGLCTYAHTKGELKESLTRETVKAPAVSDTTTATSIKPVPEPLAGPFKVRLCNFYKEGHCSKGKHCTFAHSERELRPFSYADLRSASPKMATAGGGGGVSWKASAPAPAPFRFFKHADDDGGELDEECVICCEPILKKEAETLECSHVFHTKCILTWVEKRQEPTCPTCRRKTNIRNEFPKLGI